jgi:hypothetical protein
MNVGEVAKLKVAPAGDPVSAVARAAAAWRSGSGQVVKLTVRHDFGCPCLDGHVRRGHGTVRFRQSLDGSNGAARREIIERTRKCEGSGLSRPLSDVRSPFAPPRVPDAPGSYTVFTS